MLHLVAPPAAKVQGNGVHITGAAVFYVGCDFQPVGCGCLQVLCQIIVLAGQRLDVELLSQEVEVRDSRALVCRAKLRVLRIKIGGCQHGLVQPRLQLYGGQYSLQAALHRNVCELNSSCHGVCLLGGLFDLIFLGCNGLFGDLLEVPVPGVAVSVVADIVEHTRRLDLLGVDLVAVGSQIVDERGLVGVILVPDNDDPLAVLHHCTVLLHGISSSSRGCDRTLLGPALPARCGPSLCD